MDALLTSGNSSSQEKVLSDKTKSTCEDEEKSESLTVVHTRAPSSSDSSNRTDMRQTPSE